MTELIKGLVHVRDGLTLIAFLGLVLLFAFRTNKVPELLFGLVRDKLTRKQFSVVLHRFMTLGLIAFLALVSIAVLAQVFGFMTQPGVLTIGDLRRELAKVNKPEAQKIRAEAQYNLAMTRLNERDFDDAIESLQESIRAIPTLTAQEMLTYLYRQRRDFVKESEAWEAAVAAAREADDWLVLARLDRISAPRGFPDVEGEADLIGDSAPLLIGGDRYETAGEISPGFYRCTDEKGCWSYYKLYLRTDQRLHVKLRSPPSGNLAGVVVYNTNGEGLKHAGDRPGTMRGNAGPPNTIHELAWTASSRGWHFLQVNTDQGTVVRIQVQ